MPYERTRTHIQNRSRPIWRPSAELAHHCNTLQQNATNCNTMQYVAAAAACCNTHMPQHTHAATHTCCNIELHQGPISAPSEGRAPHCNTLQHTATHCSTLQHTATHCNTLQHTATHCNTLQHTATHSGPQSKACKNFNWRTSCSTAHLRISN